MVLIKYNVAFISLRNTLILPNKNIVEHDKKNRICEINYDSKKINENKMKIKSVLLLLFFLITSTSVQLFAQSDAIQTNVPGLKDVFKNDFYIGCLLSYRHIGFSTDPAVPGQSAVIYPNGGNLIKYHMNSMSPGNNMKPVYTVDMTGSAAAYNAATSSVIKDSIDTHPIIKFNGDIIAQLNWAKRQGFTFRGHTLVWHSQTPGTGFFRSGYSATGARLTKEKMTSRMESYIKEVIRIIHESWPGLLSAYDVVNEAVNDNGSDRTTDSEWYVTFGDNSYIMKAFEFARKYTTLYNEKQIKLYYNDYSTSTSSKADGIVRVCKPIFEAGNLDGLGMQEHDQLSNPSAAAWIATYNKFAPICKEMAVTELDVSTQSGTNTPSATILNNQANQYAQLFKCFVERSYFSGRGKLINVSKDGLNDESTFVTNQATSLWDTKNQCKPAFYAVVNVGINYNKLDSILTSCKSLKESDYTVASWLNYNSALTYANLIKGYNYNTGVSAADGLGKAKDSLSTAIKSLVLKSTGIHKEENGIPAEYNLAQNYPNPFNPSTKINFSLPKDGFVSLKVYNLLGEEVISLINGFQPAGNHYVILNVSQFSSGVYLYQLKTGNFVDTKKFVLMK
jgi:GH35 family endo-1,4-beta-xylanase